MTYYELDPSLADPKRIKKEREKAQKLKKSSWWQNKIREGVCHYCQSKFLPKELTMDHVVPIARGGTSSEGNIVPSCKTCNSKKKLKTPAEEILEKLAAEAAEAASRDGNGTEGFEE
jgi:5-methylcytosine-specific restriction protein A